MSTNPLHVLPSTWDPRQDGARCSECALGPNSPFIAVVEEAEAKMASVKTKGRKGKTGQLKPKGFRPVPPEHNPGATCLIVAEAPGVDETILLRPLIGRSGDELTRALNTQGYPRGAFSFDNVISCSIPSNEFERFMARVVRHNKKETTRAKAEGRDPVLVGDPRVMCRPRLLRSAARYDQLLLVGSKSTKAFLGEMISSEAVRGTPLVIAQTGERDAEGVLRPTLRTQQERDTPLEAVKRWKVLTTVHPARALRERKWMPVFYADIGKAVRYFSNRLGWKPPVKFFRPSPQELEQFIFGQRHPEGLTLDFENPPAYYRASRDGAIKPVYEATQCDVFCVAIGNAQVVYGIPFMSIDRKTRFYEPAVERQMRDVLRRFFTDPTILKRTWNGKAWDGLIAANPANFGVTISPHRDGLLDHRLVASEYSHALEFVLTVFTDSPQHKRSDEGGAVATNARSDYELLSYCCDDTASTHSICTQLEPRVKARGQEHLVPYDHAMQDICNEMSAAGLLVDQRIRAEFQRQFEREEHVRIQKCRELAERPRLNTASPQQLSDLFFDDWGLKPVKWSEKTGEPSTDDETLIAFLLYPHLKDFQREMIRTLRKVRKAGKNLDTVYAARLERDGGFASNLDGRLRTHYSSKTAVTGRLASSEPVNCFDGETEILTEQGWARFDTLQHGVKVAQWVDGRVEFVRPTAYVVKRRRGKMVSIRNTHIDLMVTPDHRCLVRNRSTKRGVVNYCQPLRVKVAVDYPVAGNWEQLHGGVHTGGNRTLSPAQVTLLCAAQADGSWLKNRHKGHTGALVFTFGKGRKKQRLEAALKTLKITYSKYASATSKGRLARTGYYISAREVPAWLKTLLAFPAKRFGAWIIEFDSATLAAFSEEIWFWDGCWTRKNHYASNDRVNADWVQIACTLVGWRARVRVYQGAKNPSYQVDVTRRDYSYTSNVAKTCVPFSGMVYCVSVPSGFIVVRRSGTAMVTGQCQNIAVPLRAMFVPGTGMVYAGADYDAQEMRAMTALSQCQRYLKLFREDGDPHSMLAEMAWGDLFRNAPGDKKTGMKGRMRSLAKQIVYASIFWAGIDTIHGQVISAEDPATGELVYYDSELRETKLVYEAWLQFAPEIPIWWEATLQYWREHGFVYEPVLFRRRDCLNSVPGQEDRSELVNFAVQSGCAALQTLSTLELRQELAPNFAGACTGLIASTHDHLTLEIPANRGEYWAKRLSQIMTRTCERLPGVVFTAKGNTALSWDKA